MTHFKAMLKAGGEFVFLPGCTRRMEEIVGDVEIPEYLDGFSLQSPETIEGLLSWLHNFNREPNFTPLKEGRPQPLSYFYRNFEGDSATLRSFIKFKKEQYRKNRWDTSDIIKFINDGSFQDENFENEIVALEQQTYELAMWIGQEFFEKYLVLCNMPILDAVFDKVMYMRDEEYCEYKPYPFDIKNPSAVYIRCIKSLVP
ncbi:MAG: hypothetical protein K2W94_08005 [Alphaproteobacteria bacterium]|nr:hypothetical protein [Alphaproteobacteria bacterium]